MKFNINKIRIVIVLFATIMMFLITSVNGAWIPPVTTTVLVAIDGFLLVVYRKFYKLVGYKRENIITLLKITNLLIIIQLFISTFAMLSLRNVSVHEYMQQITGMVFTAMFPILGLVLVYVYFNRTKKEVILTLIISIIFTNLAGLILFSFTYNNNLIISFIKLLTTVGMLALFNFGIRNLDKYLDKYSKQIQELTFYDVLAIIGLGVTSVIFADQINNYYASESLIDVIISSLIGLIIYFVGAYIINYLFEEYLNGEMFNLPKDIFLKLLLIPAIYSLFHLSYYYDPADNMLHITGSVTLIKTGHEMIQLALISGLIRWKGKDVWLRKCDIL